MNILFFVSSLDSGGIEKYLLRYLKFEKNITATVICKSGKGGVLEKEYLTINGVIIKPMMLGYFNLYHYWLLYLFLIKKKTNVVCDFTGNFAGLVLLTAKIAGINKRIAFYRSSSNHYKSSILKNLYNTFLNSLVYNFSTKILSNSDYGLTYFFKDKYVKNEKFLVIQNGINSEEFQQISDRSSNILEEFNIPSDAFIIGHTGRFDVSKNHVTILNIAKNLCNKYKNIYFILCGQNVDLQLRKSVENLKLESRVFLSGYRKDISCVLSSLDLFLFPSLTEGQPNSLIEAMICGVPIVASDIEPIKETVPQELLSTLIPPLNVQKYTEKIEGYYNDRAQLSSLVCKEWAINKFNHKVNFFKLSDVLTK